MPVAVSVNKHAHQTSTFAQHVARLGNDGRYDTVSCTSDHVHPWWAVDLEEKFNVARVTVTNDHNRQYGKCR